MSGLGLGRVKTPTFNLRVETPSRFRKFENQKCLRLLLREDDRENNSAHSWLVHVFTQPGSKGDLTAPKSKFRSTTESGLKSDITPGPVRATSRRQVRSQERLCPVKQNESGFRGALSQLAWLSKPRLERWA